MKVTLTGHGAELLRAAHARHPQMSTAELPEEALVDRYGKEEGATSGRPRSLEEIRTWLDELASLSDKIPPRAGESFLREMIYQDHDR